MEVQKSIVSFQKFIFHWFCLHSCRKIFFPGTYFFVGIRNDLAQGVTNKVQYQNPLKSQSTYSKVVKSSYIRKWNKENWWKCFGFPLYSCCTNRVQCPLILRYLVTVFLSNLGLGVAWSFIPTRAAVYVMSMFLCKLFILDGGLWTLLTLWLRP